MNIRIAQLFLQGWKVNATAPDYGTTDGAVESQTIHFIYIWMLFVGGVVTFQLATLVILIFLSTLAVCLISANQPVSRSQELIRTMKSIQFANIIFKETVECAICLERFKQDQKVV